MRVIRLKLSKDVSTFLETYCERYAIADLPFVEDVYALVRLKGNGLPDNARKLKLAEHYAKSEKLIPVVVQAAINKRVQVLRSMATTAVFQFHANGQSSVDDMEFTESLLQSFQKMHLKLRQSQCLTCHLLSQCDFGKQYSEKVKDITQVIDPEYDKKVHSDCPHEPEIEYQQQIGNASGFINSLGTTQGALTLQMVNQQAVTGGAPAYMTPPSAPLLPPAALKQMLQWEAEALRAKLAFDSDMEKFEDDEDFDSTVVNNGFGKNVNYYNVRHIGGTTVFLNSQLIDKIKMEQLCIYQIAMKLETALAKNKKGAFKPTEELSKDRKQTNIKSINDVSKVQKRELAEDDQVFDAKLRKKALTKVQQIAPSGRKQLLYLLIDFSGSMQSYAGMSNILGFVNRAALAASFCIALSRRVCDDKGMLFARGFAGGVSELRECRTPDQFRSLEAWIADCAFNGGSTNIYNSLKTVRDDIANSRGEISKAEILLITDAQDSFGSSQVGEMRAWFEDIPLNVLDVVGGDSTYLCSAAESLKSLSDNYLKVDPKKNSISAMIDLVGTKKKATT
jgi:hypothetical protein